MVLDNETGTDPRSDSSPLRARIAHRVSELRRAAGRSLADLASAAGIGKSTLHAIESGDANPGIETLWALAHALDVPFGDLLDPPTPRVHVVRAGHGPRVVSEAANMAVHLLASTGHAARVELYELVLQPGRARAAQPHAPGTVEHLLVVDGRMRAGPLDAPVELTTGDLATFPGDCGHQYEALAPDSRAVLMIEYA